MKQLILNTFQPLIARVGTAAATLMVANGVPESSAHQALTAFGILAAIAADFFTEKYFRKSK